MWSTGTGSVAKRRVYDSVEKAGCVCGSNSAFQADSVLIIQKMELQRGETETEGHRSGGSQSTQSATANDMIGT